MYSSTTAVCGKRGRVWRRTRLSQREQVRLLEIEDAEIEAAYEEMCRDHADYLAAQDAEIMAERASIALLDAKLLKLTP